MAIKKDWLMRYLLFPDEENRFFDTLRNRRGLVPIDLDSATEITCSEREFLNDPLSPAQAEIVFWAQEIGPIIRMGDPSDDFSAKARVMRRIAADADADWAFGIDAERTPLITWTRPKWFDADRKWIVPGRLRGARSPIASYTLEYLKLFRSIEKNLRNGGMTMNTWDIQGEGPFVFDKKTIARPSNIKSYAVTVWPEAANWVGDGGNIYHWDA